jgi:quinol monooxygenase YgiN
MSEVTVVVELRIEPGRVDDFKAAAQAFVARTQTEIGTLRYDWHVNDDAS